MNDVTRPPYDPRIKALEARVDALSDRKDRLTECLNTLTDRPENAARREQLRQELDETQRDLHAQVRDLAPLVSQEIEGFDRRILRDLAALEQLFEQEDEEQRVLDPKTACLSSLRFVTLRAQYLQEAVQRLMSLISYDEIVEEMNHRKYQDRVASAMTKLENEASPIRETLAKARQQLAGFEEECVFFERWLSCCETAGHPAVARARFDQIRGALGSLSAISDRYETALGKGLRAFCGAKNRLYINRDTKHVAKRAERHWALGVLVFGNAALAVFCLQRAIVWSGNLQLLDHMTVILLAVGLGVVWLSGGIGKFYRDRRVSRLNSRIQNRLDTLFGMRGSRFVGASLGRIVEVSKGKGRGRGSDYEFPRLDLTVLKAATKLSPVQTDLTETSLALAVRGAVGRGAVGLASLTVALVPAAMVVALISNADWDRPLDRRQSLWTWGVNLAALPIDYLLGEGSQSAAEGRAAMSVSFSDIPELVDAITPSVGKFMAGSFQPESYLIGRDPQGRSCKLWSGRLVYASDKDLFLHSQEPGLLKQVFPEYFAKRVDRSQVVEIRTTAEDYPCVTPAKDLGVAPDTSPQVVENQVSILENSLSRGARTQDPALSAAMQRPRSRDLRGNPVYSIDFP